QSAPSALTDSLESQVRSSIAKCLEAALALGAKASDIPRLSIFISEEALAAGGVNDASFVYQTLGSYWPATDAPAVTVSVLQGLPGNAMVQVDGMALLEG